MSTITSDFCCLFAFESLYVIASAVFVLAWFTPKKKKKKKGERSQKIDNVTVLVTCWPGISVMLSSKVNSFVAHGSTP